MLRGLRHANSLKFAVMEKIGIFKNCTLVHSNITGDICIFYLQTGKWSENRCDPCNWIVPAEFIWVYT